MNNVMGKICVALIAGLIAFPVFGQSVIVKRSPRNIENDQQSTTKEHPAYKEEVECCILTQERIEDTKDKKVLLEQNEKGWIMITALNNSVNKKAVIYIAPTDGLGYSPLSKFMKDVSGHNSKWEKYKKLMERKKSAYARGDEVDLRFIPISSISSKKNKLEYLLFPCFLKSGDDVYSAYMECIRMKDTEGKMMEVFFTSSKFRKWLEEALNYQLSLKK
jgi:hypothetical protein